MSRGLLFGVIAAFLWGTHSVLVQYLTGSLGGLQIAVLRLYIAAATLFLMLLVLGHPVKFEWRDRNFWFATGATAVNFIFFHLGLERTDAGSAMVLENTAPFFVLLFLYLFAGVTVSFREVAATALAIAGVVLTVLPDFDAGSSRFTGDLMEIGAGISWAVFLIAGSRAMQASHSTGERLNFLLGIFVVTALLLTPLTITRFELPPAEDILPLLFLGVFASALAYYFWFEAAARLSTLTATLLFALSVVFTFVNAAIFLGDKVTPLDVAGAVLIVLGIFLTKSAEARKEA